MPLDFPNSPSIGQQYSAVGITWTWDGVKWASVLNVASPYLPLSGGEVTGPIVVTVPGTPVKRSIQDTFTDAVSVKSFGAIMDGASHPLSSKYSTLASAQAVYPHATSLSDEIDWCAIQGVVNALNPAVRIPAGTALINRPVISTSTTPVTVIGDGVNVTTVVQTTTGQDGWQHTSKFGFQMFGMTLSCNGIGGTALNLNFNVPGAAVSQFTLRDVYIVGNIFNPAGGGQGTNFWHNGIHADNPSISQLDHVWILGANGVNLDPTGDAIYYTCRTPGGSFDFGIRDTRIHYYRRGIVFDSSAPGVTVNMQGAQLNRVNYGGLIEFIVVLGSFLYMSLDNCQGAQYGAVIDAQQLVNLSVTNGLFFLNPPLWIGGMGSQLPQSLFVARGGGDWWIESNEFLLQGVSGAAHTVGQYVFNFTSFTSSDSVVHNFLRATIRDNLVYVQAGNVMTGFANIDLGSLQVRERGTTLANWPPEWPLWTNGNTAAPDAGGNVPLFQTLFTRGQPTNDQYTSEGSIIGWNYGGAGGRTSFINSRTTAVGGFEWYTTPGGGVAPTLLSTLTTQGTLFLFGDGTLSLTCTLDAALPTVRGMGIKTNGLERWIFGGDATAEPNDGSNVGSDFSVGRYTDAGAANGTPLTISRATGLTTLSSLRVTGQAGFFNTTPIAKPTAGGAWAGNTAGKALSTALAALGLITDTSTA